MAEEQKHFTIEIEYEDLKIIQAMLIAFMRKNVLPLKEREIKEGIKFALSKMHSSGMCKLTLSEKLYRHLLYAMYVLLCDVARAAESKEDLRQVKINHAKETFLFRTLAKTLGRNDLRQELTKQLNRI